MIRWLTIPRGRAVAKDFLPCTAFFLAAWANQTTRHRQGTSLLPFQASKTLPRSRLWLRRLKPSGPFANHASNGVGRVVVLATDTIPP